MSYERDEELHKKIDNIEIHMKSLDNIETAIGNIRTQIAKNSDSLWDITEEDESLFWKITIAIFGIVFLIGFFIGILIGVHYF